MKKQLVVLTEEGPNEGLIGAINYFLKRHSQKLSYTASPTELVTDTEHGVAIGWEYALPEGEFGRVVCKIIDAPSGGSFVDTVFYITDHNAIPSPADEPVFACEITKNTLAESGNMSDQRSAKFYPLIKRFPDLECCYYIHTVTPIELKGNNIHSRAFRRMLTCGVDVVFGTNEGFTVPTLTPYSSLSDFMENGVSPNPKTNRIQLREGTVEVSTNLNKSDKMMHDPNIGWASSVLQTLATLGHEGSVSIVEHNLEKSVVQSAFNGKSKFVKLVRDTAQQFSTLSVKGVDSVISPNFDAYHSGSYWKLANTGEKINSIQTEILLRTRGEEPIFTNHAGCEKSYLRLPSGEMIAIPKKDRNGSLGLPDLITKDGNILKVIEAETSRNLKGKKGKGYDQVDDPKFKNFVNKLVKEWYPDCQAEVYLSTFGDNTLGDPGVLTSTLFNGETKINLNARPHYTV